MTLYLLTTVSLGDFYVISETSSQAEQLLINALDEAQYGFTSQRKTINIKILTEEITNYPSSYPNFSSGNRLMIDK